MSTDQIGVALLSFAHVHAQGYADQVAGIPELNTVAIWDEDAERGAAEAGKRGVPFFQSLDELLAREDVQAVVCSAPTNMHKEVLVKAAQAGKHIFTEKALTINVEDATVVMTAVEESGVKFMISLPSRTRPEILFAKQVLDDGLLGQITTVRARIAHMAALDNWFHHGSAWFGQEEKAGGGAFFDLGCHRVDIMRWFLGEPESVVAQKVNLTEAYDVDDNMVAVVKFRNQALGIIDVAWTHRHGPNPLEIYGTEGYLAVEAAPNGPKIQMISNRVSMGHMEGYLVPTVLPKALPSPMQQWVSAIQHNTSCTINIYDGWALSQLLDGCYKAARGGLEFRF